MVRVSLEDNGKINHIPVLVHAPDEKKSNLFVLLQSDYH